MDYFPKISLKNNEIHIWSAYIDLRPDQLKKISFFLSSDELKKANKFKFYNHKINYIASRGILRVLLEKYIGISAKNIVFSYGEYGKPCIDRKENNISFNLSHSDNIVVYAFCIEKEIGIDIEFMRKTQGVLDALRYSLSKSESQYLEQLKSHEKIKFLYDRWVYKEAFLKAIGVGLKIPPQRVVITPNYNNFTMKIQCLDDYPLSEMNWSIQHLDIAKGFYSAICISGSTLKHRHFKWLPNTMR